MSKRIIKCKRCKRKRYFHAKGYCASCYYNVLARKKYEQSPLIKCICSPDCKVMIKSLNKHAQKIYYAKGHLKKINNNTHKKYEYIHKPYFKYSNKNGIVAKHRYVMYIYLSILNNKVTYIEGFSVHHINEIKDDNRPINLKLVTRKTHPSEHKKDMSKRFCNICKCKTTKKIFKNGKYYEHWHEDINGHLCNDCYEMVIRFKNKFFGDKYNRICNLCKTNKTSHWCNDIEGHLCYICYNHINRLLKKLDKKVK